MGSSGTWQMNKRWVIDDNEYCEDVHDVVVCFATASGCNREEIDSIKTLTYSVDLAVMRLVCERNFFQNLSEKCIASRRAHLKGIDMLLSGTEVRETNHVSLGARAEILGHRHLAPPSVYLVSQ
jgi:hypothetical protein